MPQIVIFAPFTEPALRGAVQAALESGAPVVTFGGRVVGADLDQLAAVHGAVAVTAPNPETTVGGVARVANDATAAALAKLAACRACDQYDRQRIACKLLRCDDGGPCAGVLSRRMQSGKPCPHPAGDKWRS